MGRCCTCDLCISECDGDDISVTDGVTGCNCVICWFASDVTVNVLGCCGGDDEDGGG